MINSKSFIHFTDVTARDGFQIEKNLIPTKLKVETINQLSILGLLGIEVTSFVNPKLVPQMDDAEEVMMSITRKEGTVYSVLVPNLKGAERALKCNPDQLNLLVAASDTFNLKNIRSKTFDTLANSKQIVKLAENDGVRTLGCIATAFGCPFEGEIPEERVIKVVEEYVRMGTNAVVLADTTGMATPDQIKSLVRKVKKERPLLELHLHLHNTRGMGLVNAYAGFTEGVYHLDASVGGIGGCPFAPKATGNICLEDAVHMFENMNVQTGIDLEGLINFSRKLELELGYTLPGQVMKAGKISDLHLIENE